MALFRNRCFFTDKELFEQYEMKYKAHLDVEKVTKISLCLFGLVFFKFCQKIFAEEYFIKISGEISQRF